MLHAHTHTPRMLASFADHLIGVVDTADQAEAALRDIRLREHIPEDHLELLTGEDGEARLDFTGERHGLLARLRRDIQKMTDDYEYARRYELELQKGHALIVVGTRYEEQARRLCSLLREHGGHFIHFYGPLMVESFCPDPDAR